MGSRNPRETSKGEPQREELDALPLEEMLSPERLSGGEGGA